LRAKPAPKRMTTLKITKSVDTAAMVGLISVLNPSHNFFGRVDKVGLLIKSAMISSSNEIRKAKSRNFNG